MRFENGEIHFAPSDLAVFWESEFAAWMERWDFERRRAKAKTARLTAYPDLDIAPDVDDDDALLLRNKGGEHEKATLLELGSKNGIVTIDGDPSGAKTRQALDSGAAIIYHATLRRDRFGGQPDFLMRNGDGHYEVAEAKLARSAKPEHVLQMCIYADLLAHTGVRCGDHFKILLGDGTEAQLPVARYRHYARRLVHAFLAFHQAFDGARTPHPGATAKHGRWSEAAERIIAATDHPRRLPSIRGDQIRKLAQAGIETRTALAALDIQDTGFAKRTGIAHETLHRLVLQARLQIASETQGKLQYARRPAPAAPKDRPVVLRRGLALLPPASPLDVFFDMEGHPLAEGPLEYLFGATHDGTFTAWWALRRADERSTFEAFVDWVHERWERDPTMHVYHYGVYETAALKRLMGTYATRENEVDDLLRNEVFVDLYRVVQQGLVIGAEGYSLKDIEPLYRPARGGKVKTAAGCMAAFERWLDTPDGDSIETSRILRDIHDYNRDDCDSTRDLAAWLRSVQHELGVEYTPTPEPEPVEENTRRSRNLQRREGARALAVRLATMADEATDPEEKRIGRLLAQLVEFHWRENKPVWWLRYERLAMEEDELFKDLECIAGCETVDLVPTTSKNKYEYDCRFDAEQETKLSTKDQCILVEDAKQSVEIVAIDPDEGTLRLRTGSSLPERFSLLRGDIFGQDPLEDSLRRQAEAWSNAEGPNSAVLDFLQRRTPRIRGHAGGPILARSESLEVELARAIDALDESTLCIQGPPGTGKTYTASHVIYELLQRGRRIGVAAHAHKAIYNLMREVHERACNGAPVALIKVRGEADDPLVTSGGCQYVEDNKDAAVALERISGGVLIGATAYVFARQDMAGKLDMLFVDEAGQVSVANLVAAAPAARNLVLIGDQMQLGQPLRGAHPDESGQSALEYLLQDRATIPPELGVFLGTTYRMHPDLCAFVSAAVYDDRLGAAEKAGRRSLAYAESGPAPDWLRRGTGIAWRPVEHYDNGQSSIEEVDEVERVVAELLRCSYTNEKGESRRLVLDDVLVVAPYNMQVRRLHRRLEQRFDRKPRVGTVDRFQGLQAPAVIVSMCASSLEDVPRGLDFLLSKNRLNVAVSRAQCLAVVVGSPALLVARARSLAEMQRLDFYCRLVEHAESLAQVPVAR